MGPRRPPTQTQSRSRNRQLCSLPSIECLQSPLATDKPQLNFNLVAASVMALVLLSQVITYKKIKLNRYLEWTLSAISVGLTGHLVYLAFLS